MSTSDYLPYPTVKRWQEAGASLMSTLEHYKHLCLTLGPESLSEGARPDDLVAKLLSAFDLHATVSRQLVECTSALQKVRNTLVSPFFRLPEEITLNIFMHFVYHPKNTEIHRLGSVEHDVHLEAHCSEWTKLWSVTPMIQGPSNQQQTFQLGLQRAGASDLHLVATNELSRLSGDFIDLLAKHHTRFHAINLSAYDPEVIRDALGILTEAGKPESLTKLSIRVSNTYHTNSGFPQKLDYIIPHDHPRLDLFTNMLQGLTHFHTSGPLIRWDILAFSTRLVQLMINDVMLGYDEEIIPFIQTLSSASELRDLKIISITTVKSSAFNSNAIKTSLQPTQFPKLQSLLIQNIYFNTLRVLLPNIAPGSHRLTLFLSPRCLRFKILEDVDSDDDEAEDSANVADLCKILEPIPVDTLMVTAFQPIMRVKPDIIYSILKAMPTLKTLKIDCWTFTQDSWAMLSRPPVTEDSSKKTPFPALENLHLTTASFRTRTGLREMLASHPLRRVVLGALVRTTIGSPISLERCTTAMPWLEDIAQEVRIVHPDYRPIEFYEDVWRLW
ncbi:Toll-like receptor 5 [Rhizoctonia solani]|uniref:Toll-like receptor 5 n=1 Tax=Rhizoctonia solani TaxID=456999 RepID=A0A0K6G6V2_9AGAM|nr:Toll-like receptor 5 [Rhizoctonia solani]